MLQKEKLWHMDTPSIETTIDHILTDKSYSYYFTDAGVTQMLIDSDHRAVQCKLRLCGRLKKRSTARQRSMQLDYSGLKCQEIRDAFCRDVVENFNTQPEYQSKYSRLASAVADITHKTLPRKTRPQPGWFNSAQNVISNRIQERCHVKGF